MSAKLPEAGESGAPGSASVSPSLTAAILCISTTLDFDTVLAEMVASASRLTRARYGSSSPLTRRARPRTSSSPASRPKERQELLAKPGSGRLIQHLREPPGPLRLADLAAYTPSRST